MKIIFMGTPRFAVPALSAIYEAGHDIKCVVTQPDKKRGRGNKVRHTPVKERALDLGIEVLEPEKLKGNEEITGKIAGCEPDLIVVAAYGKLLPPDILRLPRYGCVNIHASLLPRWRGADPIRRAVIEGDEMTGVTIMYMDEGLDTGDIIMKESAVIGKKAAPELTEELSAMGAKLIVSAIEEIKNGSVIRTAQDEGLAVYAAMVAKDEEKLNFNESPDRLERLTRGAEAYTFYKGELMKVWEAEALDLSYPYKAGTIADVSDKGILVSAGGKALLITQIQMPGKKRVKIKEFLKGNKIEKFAVLG